jgi:Restriction endonuclease NotI
MLIAEVFGRDVLDISQEANQIRKQKLCPFKGGKCNKSSNADPLGICTLASNDIATAICPVRFLEGDKIFKVAAEIAFGKGSTFAIFPEIKLLNVEDLKTGRTRKIGKVDFLLGKVDGTEIVDFAALEIQATYFSGLSIRPALKHYLEQGILDKSISDRRPDFRSSAQKRLMPQLQLKVPVFRRWGKKFFVVVDTAFFAAMPKFKITTLSNSEIIWLCFPIEKTEQAFSMRQPTVIASQWDDVSTALREGQAPESGDIVGELSKRLAKARLLQT